MGTKISTVLDEIESRTMALPEFQRGFVWTRIQIRALFHSLYRQHPIGGLLVWETDSEKAPHRGGPSAQRGPVRLLLDGQQRMTSLYGVIRGKTPPFFEGNAETFSRLYFHIKREEFEFYQPSRMKNDPLWIDVTRFMAEGADGIKKLLARWPEYSEYTQCFVQLLLIEKTELHVEKITGSDKTVDVIVDIFNRINSGGTKLSKGDLALAKISVDWPEARKAMRRRIVEWKKKDYDFKLDWLLRSVNTVLTGKAKFHFLHGFDGEKIRDGLERATKQINHCLNLIEGRLGLDHDRVLFGRFAVPVMVHYLEQHDGDLTQEEEDKLLFWYLQTAMWGRYSGSTETAIDADIASMTGDHGALDGLLHQVKRWHGKTDVVPEHFSQWGVGARFYPVLYWLTRMGGACDLLGGIPLKEHLLGKESRLEKHHLFPRGVLYKSNRIRVNKAQVNAVSNYCFLTQKSNRQIRDRKPEEYFPECEAAHPGVLKSQWIPMDEKLWTEKNYLEFLQKRKELLAEEANRRLRELLHGETGWFDDSVRAEQGESVDDRGPRRDEEKELRALNEWMNRNGLSEGIISHEHVDVETGRQIAVIDLAWPDGIQRDLTQPVAVLLSPPADVVVAVAGSGYRPFIDINEFRAYVRREFLPDLADDEAA